MICRIENSQRGQALLFVVLVTSLVLALTTGVLEVAGIHRRNIQYQRQQVQAYYIAEAGIERVIARIREDPRWLDGFGWGRDETVTELTGPYAGGEIRKVTLHKSADGPGLKIEVTSLGKFVSAQKTLKATLYYVSVQNLLGGLSLLPPTPLDLDIRGNFSLMNTGLNRGKLLLNGNLTLSGSAYVDADVYVSGSVEGWDKIEGQVYTNVRDFPRFPELNLNYYETEARQAGQYYSGNVTLSGTGVYTGVYYVKGNLTFSGTYSGQATFVVEGDVSIPRDLLPASSYDRITIICLGDVDIENSQVKAIIIAGGTFHAKGNAELEGALMAQGLNFGGLGIGEGDGESRGGGRGEGGGGNVTIRYNPQLIELYSLIGVLPQLKILSWKENYPVF